MRLSARTNGPETVKKLTSIAAALLLASCSGSASDRYDGIEPVTVPLRDIYRVYDKPTASLILVTGRAGAGPYQGAGIGPTFSEVESRVPRPIFQAAAEKFFAAAGRGDCRITDGYPLARSAFEFSYACGSQKPRD
jgi:hypothetical protein